MDTTDPEIVFDSNGVCNHCHEFDEIISKGWFPNDEGKRKLSNLIEQIKLDGQEKPYDCILGLSGGVDSSYLALKAKEWGLRTLVIHVDGGWNREIAVANIEKIIDYCNFDLDTHVVDWDEMRDLQLAFLRAAVANQDIPQDHVFFAALYHYAIQNGIKTILSGGNIATEGISPRSWMSNAMDSTNLFAIHKKYGERRLKTFSTISFFKYYLWYPFVKKMRAVRPLNLMPYNKDDAIATLESTIGWSNYGRKHGESHFTKLFQNYYLPMKFGYDKRKPHLSSLIVSGQLTREEALNKLSDPLYDKDELENDISFFCNKMQINRQEFDELMAAPIHHYSDFPNQDRLFRNIKRIQKLSEGITGKRLRLYS
jgi:N-acetyl sugar amidotransferase